MRNARFEADATRGLVWGVEAAVRLTRVTRLSFVIAQALWGAVSLTAQAETVRASGLVVDSHGRPVVAAAVAVVVAGETLTTVRTDALGERGRFVCARLPMGRYLVRILADGRAPGFARWAHPATDAPEFRVGDPVASPDIRLSWPPQDGGAGAQLSVSAAIPHGVPAELPREILRAVEGGYEHCGIPESLRIAVRAS